MNLFLTYAYIFFIGSTLGWCMEVVYRRFFSDMNPERRWINPGFCNGPYLPLYGCGLCILYAMGCLGGKVGLGTTIGGKLLLFLLIAFSMTLLEYISGFLGLKVMKVMLWDYSNEWGNIRGLICPKFTFFWGLLGTGYYFLVHPRILDAIGWLARNLAFSFVIGFFFGVFTIDAAVSTRLILRLKKYAEENDVIVRVEALKARILEDSRRRQQKVYFFFAFRTDRGLREHLEELRLSLEEKKQELEGKKQELEENLKKIIR